MPWDKETSFCIQNLFSEKGTKFYYARLALASVDESQKVFPVLKELGAEIKFGTFARIAVDTFKWSFTFGVADEIDVPALIGKLEGLGLKALTNWDEDIIYLADGMGYSPEYPIIGFSTLKPEAAHPIIFAGGMWKRLMASIDEMASPDGTDIVMHKAGLDQGSYMAGGLAKMFGVPASVNDAGFSKGVTTLFRAYGYCDINTMEVDAGGNLVKRIVLNHTFFNSNNPEGTCHFQRGVFDGFFTTLLGGEHEFEENECKNRGQDHCVFTVEE